MSRIFDNLEIGIDEELEEKLQWLMPEHGPYRILRQSVDARRRHSPHFVYSVEVAEKNEQLKINSYPIHKQSYTKSEKPIIIGSGPAGLFAALRFVERGIPCTLFERGSQAEERIKGINHFWRYGKLDPRNNVCFGEGGAGLYSDGKLITRIKSPYIPYVLHRLVKFGAPEEIQWLANPHVGSDKIRRIIPLIRKFLIENNCEIHYNTQVTQLLFDQKCVIGVESEYKKQYLSNHVILATGHSANDMLQHLNESQVFLEGKSFAVGLRVEHPQTEINQIQYREFANHPKLGSANYRLTYHDHKSNIGVYSFCMCPGGYVLSSGTEQDGLVCNGMSNFNRNSPYANAAIVVSIDHDKLFKNDLLGGLHFRRQIESDFFKAVQNLNGTKELPSQKLEDFLSGKLTPIRKGSSPSGAIALPIHEYLPIELYQKLKEGFESFEKNMKGFISKEAQVYAIESRTSCPVRITRDQNTLQSLSHKGLYPCGEGAGYAGGITSAACDGVKIADQISKELIPNLELTPY